ncbi:hypothetical protein [Rhizosaccharibacter radicis]|uniref:Tetratricopeptide repeat protein n=1 Tax=Rhizosaccharibacter radicis TaxID=2782605 RepID=A0ABT1VZJ6_9PROT|nr:hypothetical protein [Acetobacteraceae bacterium KSS12]
MPPDDAAMRLAFGSGHLAMQQRRFDLAATDFGRAAAEARARDDRAAIAAAGFDLATARLAAGDPDGSLRAAADARRSVAARGRAGAAGDAAESAPRAAATGQGEGGRDLARALAALDLVEAAARLRSGDPGGAARAAARAEASDDAALSARAALLHGLAADALGDGIALRRERDRLAALLPPLPGKGGTDMAAGGRADLAELDARLFLRAGDPAAAASKAGTAAAARRELLDYRGMARALALRGTALARAGQAANAAGCFLAAGESAAEQGDRDQARAWLARAQQPGVSSATWEAAAEAIRRLDKATPKDSASGS